MPENLQVATMFLAKGIKKINALYRRITIEGTIKDCSQQFVNIHFSSPM